MNTSIALVKPPYSLGVVPVLVALLTVFLLGGASGYLVKGTAVPAAAPSVPSASTACPSGTHVTVWYTARTWACVPDSNS